MTEFVYGRPRPMEPAPTNVQAEAEAFMTLMASLGQGHCSPSMHEATFEPTGIRYRIEMYAVGEYSGLVHELFALRTENARLRKQIGGEKS